VFLIMRHGRPIAEIGPVTPSEGRIPAWKKPGVRLVSKGARLAAAIIQERAHERVL
jgi:antitoxin (DNA-binding transcriptional repressor) of toxin-antitoxin stability system